MAFITEEKDGITIITVDEERLDSMVAPQLKSELLVLTNEGVKDVLIDLSKVSYADSSGLGALLFGVRQFKNNEGKLRLLGANNRIMNLVRIARLDGILPNYHNIKEAILSFEPE